MKDDSGFKKNEECSGIQIYENEYEHCTFSNKIEGIAITIEDIKGAIIDQLQAVDLLYLLGVELK